MPTEALTEEQATQAEMDKFTGGSTTDGVASDGEATEDENTRMAAQTDEAASAAAVAAANETKRLEDEAKAAKAAGGEKTAEEKAAAEAAAKAAKTGKPVQERINEITRQARTAERERDAARQELADLKAGKQPLTASQAATTTTLLVAPDPKDFEFGELDTKYISALAKYEVRVELAEDRKVRDAETGAKAQETALAEFQVRVDAFAEKGAEKFDDFNDLVIEGAKAGDWNLSQTIGELILDSDYGHEIAHMLASDPAEAARIFKLPASAQAAKFGRLEAKFEAEAAGETSAPAPKEPKVSTAPPPLKTPRSNAGQFQVDGSTKDFAAFEALANAK